MKRPVENKHCEDLKKEEDKVKGKRSKLAAEKQLTIEQMLRKTQVADHWGISDKVVAIVTDNASNMVAAIRITGWTHIHCFAHTLNHVVREAIKNDPTLLRIKKKCCDIFSP